MRFIHCSTPPLRKASAASAAAMLIAFASPCAAQTVSLPGQVLRSSPPAPTRASPTATPISKGTASDDVWARRFYLQVRRCWKHPFNSDRERPQAGFVVKLTRTGQLDGAPKSLQSPRTDYEKRCHASAVAALVACQPYDLPQDAYDRWRHFEPVFREVGR
jgi:hypothetical protein